MKRPFVQVYIVVILLAYVFFLWNNGIERADLRFYLITIIVLGYVYYAETIAHRQRKEHWDRIRLQGKVRFIFMEYALLRGGIVSSLLLLTLSFQVSISLIIICSVIPVLGAAAYAGSEVWKECEQKHLIDTLKSAAENVKTSQN